MPPRTLAPTESATEAEDGETIAFELPEAEAPATVKGRGAGRKMPAAGKAARKPKGHTIYLPDDLFERILVQAHRRDKTISEYVTMILDRQVPDYRTIRADVADEAGAA